MSKTFAAVLTAIVTITAWTSAHAATYYKFKEEVRGDVKTCYYKNYGSGRIVTEMVGAWGYCPYSINR